MAVQSSVLWPENSTLSVHKSHSASGCMGEKPGYPNPCLYRRLVNRGKGQTNIASPDSKGTQESPRAWLDSKCREILFSSNPKLYLSGHGLQHREELCAANSQKNYWDCYGSPEYPNREKNISEAVTQSNRQDDFCGPATAIGKAREKALTVSVKGTLGRGHRVPRWLPSNHTSYEKHGDVVGRPSEPRQRSFYSGLQRSGTSPDRCLTRRMGSSSERPHGLREVVPAREPSFHKCPRIMGCRKGSTSISEPSGGKESPSIVRQYDCGLSHHQGRRDKILHPVQGSEKGPAVVQRQWDNSGSQTHSRKAECAGRQTESSGPSHLDRMVPGPSGVQRDHPSSLHSPSGSVCNEVEPSDTPICLPLSRSESAGNRCSESGLGHPGTSLPVPANSADPSLSAEDTGVQQQVPSCDAMLATQDVVSPVAKSGCGLPTIIASKQKTVVTGLGQGEQEMAPPPRNHELGRLDLIRRHLVKRGFSQEATDKSAVPQRSSTIRLYDNIWKRYVGWLVARGTPDPLKTTVQLLILYLLDLKNEGKAIGTVLTHKSCIVKTLEQITDQRLTESGTLADFLKSLKQEAPKEGLKFPKWELCVVLKGLRQAPFEPLNEVPIKMLTLKTVFLIALASAARVSEINALSAEQGFVRIKEDKTEVILRPFDGFLAKNQRGDEAPREYSIKSLRHFAPEGDPERLLCPVRAIRIYLNRTNKFRGDRKKLFLSLNPGQKTEICVNTISRWIRDAIQLSYQMQGLADIEKMYNVSAHEVRAISTSLAVWRNVSIKNILQAAHWKSHNTFTDYYLRDMCASTKKLVKQGSGVVCVGKEIVLNI